MSWGSKEAVIQHPEDACQTGQKVLLGGRKRKYLPVYEHQKTVAIATQAKNPVV
jgi:hypothetical protein